VAAVLHAPGLPLLEQLTVRRWVVTETSSRRDQPEPEDDLALEVTSAAATRGLARLDLDVAISPHGVRRLLAIAAELGAIGAIHIPAQGVDRALRPSLSKALPALTWTAPPEVDEPNLDAIDARPPPLSSSREYW
jgi:hypothetical protein